MNIYHRWYCGSGRWHSRLSETVLPWVTRDIDLGEATLEIGPGPGLVTDLLRERTQHLTCIEIDPHLAGALQERLRNDPVRVIEGDAASMPFDNGEFTSVISMTMLHHLPSPARQDALFAEAARVLRPGGVFLGMDSTSTLSWRLAHLMDTCTPVDPDSIETRLRTAGFDEVRVRLGKNAFRFRATVQGPVGPAGQNT